jgi:hypothetical protein
MRGSKIPGRAPEGSDDRYLSFGLWGVPAFVATPVTSRLEGQRFDQLTCGAAAEVLAGIVYLQWVKTGLVALVALIPVYLTDSLRGWAREAVLVPIFTFMMLLPSYMMILGVLWLLLRRTKAGANSPIGPHQALLRAIRLAPALSVLPAILFALLPSYGI